MNNGNDRSASKYQPICEDLEKSSYDCIEMKHKDKSLDCTPFFQAYRDCKKKHNDKMLEERRKRL